MFAKTGCLHFKYGFSLNMVSEVTVWKSSTQALPQVEKVTSNLRVKYWRSADLLFLIKNKVWNGFCQQDLWICSEYVLYKLSVETIPRRFCWLNCRKQKLAQRKILEKGLFALISSIHFRQVFVHYLMFISVICT